mgnify:FL=1|jgi:hypothetical protein
MKATKVENRNTELINTVENAQKLAKEQENPSYTKMFLPWVEQVAEDETKELASRLKEILDDASETDERYKQLKTDYEKTKERFEAYQLKTANTDKQTLKAFKKAVAVAVAEVAAQTNTTKWFSYRSLYGLGLLDKLPNMVNTTNKVNSFVVKAFTFVKQYAKRSNELARKERALNAAVAKFGITKEQAEQMYLAGMLKL